MKKLVLFMLVAVVMVALSLAGCLERAKSGQTTGEHPAKGQPKSEHPTEHPK